MGVDYHDQHVHGDLHKDGMNRGPVITSLHKFWGLISVVWNLQHVTLLAPRVFKWLLDFVQFVSLRLLPKSTTAFNWTVAENRQTQPGHNSPPHD